MLNAAPIDGEWIQDHPLPSGKSRYGIFNQLEEGNNLVLQRIINNPPKATNAADIQVYSVTRFVPGIIGLMQLTNSY